MSCPPSTIYACIACISLMVYAFVTYKHQENGILHSVLNIFGAAKLQLIHIICSVICGICGILCVASLIDMACTENMIIGWLSGGICIIIQLIGLYKLYESF